MNKKKNYNVEMLPFEVIVAAKQGDTLALCKVLEHYDGYIARLCTRMVRDEYGNCFPFVDEEMRNRLKVRLIFRTLTFNITVKVIQNTHSSKNRGDKNDTK